MVKRVHVGNAEVEIVQGDITDQPVDAIVNAANDQLWMGGGVAGAIKRKGGEAIELEAMAQGPIPIGHCVLTSAGTLPARRVIHAAVMGQDLHTSPEFIRAATRRALELAEFEGLASIALPAFGTGVGEFSMAECAKILVDETVRTLQHTTRITIVRFVVIDDVAAALFAAALKQKFTIKKDR